MFISTENEIISLMPTARWEKPEELKGYLEEEERVALEPLLGTPLYLHLCEEYQRLRNIYVDITPSTINPLSKAKHDPGTGYSDVTEHQNRRQSCPHAYELEQIPAEVDTDEVSFEDMQTIRLILICQQIEFYRMLSHKSGLLTVSFNAGGGMNMATADGYDPATEKRIDRAVMDALHSAGRSVDSLLLFLEADAKGGKQFTELWQQADAFYLHKDLLFQTARVLNEYLDIDGDRKAYVAMVRDIRFCQNTYLKPRIGIRLLKAVIGWANTAEAGEAGEDDAADEVYGELLDLLRTALAFYVEGRRVDLDGGKKMARRDSMTDAQQAMADACQWIEQNLDRLGDAAVGSPIYDAVMERQRKEQYDREHREQAECRRRMEACRQQSRKFFTAFPHTHRTPEHK